MNAHLPIAMAIILCSASTQAAAQSQPRQEQRPQGQQQSSQAQHEQHSLKPGEVAVIGCLMREADYRAVQEKSGTRASTGGNEYVLAKAAPAPATGRGAAPTATTRDYSLTGSLERNLVNEVGRMVEVVGTVKEESGSMPRLTVSLAHPVGDFCPASATPTAPGR